jgi:hypothetical protein
MVGKLVNNDLKPDYAPTPIFNMLLTLIPIKEILYKSFLLHQHIHHTTSTTTPNNVNTNL